jgi:hypothetical protein
MKILHILSIFLIGFIFAFMNVNAVEQQQGQGRVLHVEKRNVRMADNGKYIVSDISD